MGSTKTKMNVWQLTMITAINMIGSGLIMLPADLAQVGTMSILSWIITTIGATALAYGFARCGMFSKRDGGMGGYSEYTFGKSGNFMANYGYAIACTIANVAIAVTIVGYALTFLGIKLSPAMNTACVILVVWLTTIPNFFSAKITGIIGSFTIWGIIGPVIIFCIIGWFWFSPSLFAASWNPHHLGLFHGISQSISITLWAFLGLESASANMEAVENPQRDVPIACLGGTIGAGIIYIVSTSIIQGIVPGHLLANSNAPFGLVFATMFTPLVGKIVTGIMVLACFGSLLAWQFTLGQVFKSSAGQNYFPKIFKKVSKKDVPVVGLVILCILQSLFALLTISPTLNKEFETIVNLSIVTNMIPYVLSMAAVPVIQKCAGIKGKSALIPSIITFLAGVYSLYAMYTSGAQAMLYGGVVALFGWTLYGALANRFEKENDLLNKDFK
ncbi:putrescine-ornithine antiporter [Clostridium thermobutyricum]|uniref:Putrescine transporter n=1 Tax=Clostridium thermobutyricum TaxID=29372 RepID=N9WAF7_9CLOT|nr:putrescine-ornithine antiporter [Clostridium thermobutyricum]ENZ00006.1 basic amino acid/polyamine antiporter (APA) family transporter [Clostridium thermobutyricum]